MTDEERSVASEIRRATRFQKASNEWEELQRFLCVLLEKHEGGGNSNLLPIDVKDLQEILEDAHEGMNGDRRVCAVCDCIQLRPKTKKVQMKQLTVELAREFCWIKKHQDVSPQLLTEYDITPFCENLDEETKTAFRALWLSPRGLYAPTEDGNWRKVDQRTCVFAVSYDLRIVENNL